MIIDISILYNQHFSLIYSRYKGNSEYNISGQFGNITINLDSYSQAICIDVIISSDLFRYVILIYITIHTYTSYSVYVCTII